MRSDFVMIGNCCAEFNLFRNKFRAVQFLNVLILTLLCVLLFNLVKVTEFPPVWERATNSAYHLLFRCLLRYVCSPFPLMFRTSFGFKFAKFLNYLY